VGEKVLLMTLAGALAAGQAPKKDQELLQGTWMVVSAESRGQKAREEVLKDFTVVIKDDTLTARSGRFRNTRYRFTLDSTKQPKAIDLALLLNDPPSIHPGIYELDGDNLKICFTLDKGGERPAKFETKPGSDEVLWVLKRQP
jgi:uncharacterized protein (TIGR03067 family)